ncbi:MAG: hypothetical protein ABI690_15815 [Chloroflexota bacterium]
MLNSIREWNTSMLFRCLVAIFFLSVLLPSMAFAQSNTYSGWLSVLYGDPQPGSGEAPRFLALLNDGHNTTFANLNIDSNLADNLQGQYVEVTGTTSELSAQEIGSITIQVQSIHATTPPPRTELAVSAQSSGSQPFVNLKCQFPDRPPLARDHTFYDQLFSSTYPGLDNYWRQMSYNQINLTGTTLVDTWYTLPHLRSYYLHDDTVYLANIAYDCTQAANAAVNFPNFVGINIMLNDSIGCCAWGTAGMFYTLDGVSKSYPTTWLPPWGQEYSTLGHEMGHGFGLPHSSGPASNPPQGYLSIYISDWDIMSNSSGAFVQNNGAYGYTPPGTIGYHVDLAGWMPSAQKAVIVPGRPNTITLEQLRATPASLPANTYLMAQIPITGSATHFYTVEVRAHTSYDVNIPYFVPSAVVLIFEVDTTRETNAGHALIVDVDYANGSSNGNVNDAGAMWTTGEKFFDSRNGISIAIGALVGTHYSVTIAKESAASAAPVRNLNRTGTATLNWNRVSWAVGYNMQIDDSSTFATPFTYEANNLPPSQLWLTRSLPDGIYYWRVCALKTDSTCGSWSTPESFQIDTSP